MRYRRIQYRYTRRISLGSGEVWTETSKAYVAPTHWRPPFDMLERGDDLEVHIDLAGVDESDIEITLYADALVVTGTRRSPDPGDARFHAAGIRYGPFRLELPLPFDVDVEHAVAQYDLGMLTVGLRREASR